MKPEKARIHSQSSSGFTLLEMAIAIVVFSVIGLATTMLVTSSVSATVSYREHEIQHGIALDIVDRLRLDLRFAQADSVNISGNTLSFETFDANANNYVAVTYSFNGTTLIRNFNGNTLDFGAIATDTPVKITCGNPCFQGVNNTGMGPVNRSIKLHDLVVESNGTLSSPIDRSFGAAQFRIEETTFDVLNGVQFQ